LGRLSRLKADLLPIVPVIESLVKNNPKRKLVWVLAGTEDRGYTTTLLKEFRERSLDKCVRVMLGISDRVKESLLSTADIFVSAADSVMESFGLTPLEAMASGVPQVVSDWDGYRDTVRDRETGFLVPTYWMKCTDDLNITGPLLGWQFDHLCLGQSAAVDLSHLARALQCLIDNEELRNEMGKRSRQRAIADYRWEVIVSQYESLWRELSDVASHLKQFAPRRPSLRNYHRLFGHYASVALKDETKIRITARAKQVKDPAALIPSEAEMLKDRILDARLLRKAFEMVLSGEDGSGSGSKAAMQGASQISIGAITSELDQSGAYPTDYVRRHIMYLIKYGVAEPVSQNIKPSGKAQLGQE
jgi:D-inositol-3-phosphate glycosyltransferase